MGLIVILIPVARLTAWMTVQRHDLHAIEIPINQTGFLGPASSVHGDLSPYNQTGYSTCWDDHNSSCDMVCQRNNHANSCWESWKPSTWLQYMLAQAGPGGNVHVDNEDMIGDAACGQLDLNGNRFVDQKQRPQDCKCRSSFAVSRCASQAIRWHEFAPELLCYTTAFCHVTHPALNTPQTTITNGHLSTSRDRPMLSFHLVHQRTRSCDTSTRTRLQVSTTLHYSQIPGSHLATAHSRRMRTVQSREALCGCR